MKSDMLPASRKRRPAPMLDVVKQLAMIRGLNVAVEYIASKEVRDTTRRQSLSAVKLSMLPMAADNRLISFILLFAFMLFFVLIWRRD